MNKPSWQEPIYFPGRIFEFETENVLFECISSWNWSEGKIPIKNQEILDARSIYWIERKLNIYDSMPHFNLHSAYGCIS